MNEKQIPTSLRSTRTMCQVIAKKAIDLFVERLSQEAKPGPDGKGLDSNRITGLARAFKDDEEGLLNPLLPLADGWLGDIERELWEKTRKRPFERLLVKRFSHKFPPLVSLDSPATVSRRVIPGLFQAFELIAGSEFMEQCQGTGRGIFRDVRSARGEEFRWSDYYDDQAANDLVDDLMAVVARSFKDFDKRLDWLIELINGHLAPPEGYEYEGHQDTPWALHPDGAREMLRALFSKLRDNMADGEARRLIERRYGENVCKLLEAVIGDLYAGA